MSETTPPDDEGTATSADDIRQHSQTPAEGRDLEPEFEGAQGDESPDGPREHSPDPVQG